MRLLFVTGLQCFKCGATYEMMPTAYTCPACPGTPGDDVHIPGLLDTESGKLWTVVPKSLGQ